jgi:putative FmdB family regulatory protein
VPLYEYDCGTCGSFELIRRFSDPPLETCPTCSGLVEKRFSAPAFQFKGTGWYITDYARKGNAGDNAKGEAKKDAAPPTTAPSTTDSKSTSSAADSSTSAKPSAAPAVP